MTTKRLTLVLATAFGLGAVTGAPASASVKRLPANFLWGVSSSAFQTEGHTTNS
jgi:hypothetical protein